MSYEQIRPIFRYPGSKWNLSRHLADIIRGVEFSQYCEPFLGSAAVFLRLHREELLRGKRCILNDIDGEIFNLLEVMRSQSAALVESLELTPYSRAEFAISESRSEELSPVERARRFLVFRNMGHTGQRSRHHSVDNTGSHQRAWQSIGERVSTASALFRGAEIEKLDATEFLARYSSPESLIYVDPPYLSTEYLYKESKGMQLDYHRSLAQTLAAVPAAAVVVSYYPHPLLEELYPPSQWERIEIPARATMGNKGYDEASLARTELLLVRSSLNRLPTITTETVKAASHKLSKLQRKILKRLSKADWHRPAFKVHDASLSRALSRLRDRALVTQTKELTVLGRMVARKL